MADVQLNVASALALATRRQPFAGGNSNG